MSEFDLTTAAGVATWILDRGEPVANGWPTPGDTATLEYLAECVRLREAFDNAEDWGADMWESQVKHYFLNAMKGDAK